jgi:hypothetical protein
MRMLLLGSVSLGDGLKKGLSYWQCFEVNLKKRKKVKIKDVVGVRENDTINRKKRKRIQNRNNKRENKSKNKKKDKTNT